MQTNYWDDWDKAYERALEKLKTQAIGSEFIGVLVAWICLELFLILKPVAIAGYKWALPRLSMAANQIQNKFVGLKKEWHPQRAK